jgi:hypothetical protein
MLRMSLTRSICPPFRPPSSGKQSPSGKAFFVLHVIKFSKNSNAPLIRPCNCSMKGQVLLGCGTDFEDFTTKNRGRIFLSKHEGVARTVLRYCYVAARYKLRNTGT